MKKVTNKTLWIFAIGQLGWSLLSALVVNWIVFFYQPTEETIAAGQTVFIPQGAVFLGLTIIGLIAAAGRLFDAFFDPWVAGLSDRSRNPRGRRIPFMKKGAIPLGATTALIFFCPVGGTSTLNAVYLFVMVLLFYLCLTTYCTPYNALIPVLGKTQENRINLSTFISVTFFAGTGIAYLLPNIAAFFEPSFGYVGSLRLTVGALAAIGIVCALIPTLVIDEKDYADAEVSDTPAFKSLVKTFKNKTFRTFVASDVLYWIALTIFQTGLPFYITVLMKLDESMSFLLFAIMTVLSLVFYVPVNLFAKKFGKKKIVVGAYLFYGLVFLLTTLCGRLGIGGLANGLLIAGLAAVPMAILGILPQAMVADVAEYDSILTKENREGMFYAARTFAFKLGQSVALLLFTSLAKIGSDGMGYRISALIAGILCLLGGFALMRYDEKTLFKSLAEKDVR